ncbi:MAG: hypothetical protein KDI44_02520 [Thiothrix sp.]|nr:hypothetical protein [Thiothrix sp.]HPQ97094.1 hypothetical protein [Thiolinea sp.]
MILPPPGWTRCHNLLRPLPSGRWMPFHDRNDPDFGHIQHTIPDGETDYFGKQPRPALLRQLNESLKDLFFHPERHIAWCWHRTTGMVAKWGATLRLMRSQMRENIVKLLSVMILNMDLATLLVARRDAHNHLHHYTLGWLGEQAGLSPSQAKRVSAWLHRVGIISNDDQVCERQADGSYRGRAAPKRLSARLFAYFGLDAELQQQREWARERDATGPAPTEREQLAREMQADKSQLSAMKALLKGMSAGSGKATATPVPATKKAPAAPAAAGKPLRAGPVAVAAHIASLMQVLG